MRKDEINLSQKHYSINKLSFAVFILYFWFMNPSFLGRYPFFDRLFAIGMLVSSLLLLFYLFAVKRIRVSRMFLLVFILETWIFLISLYKRSATLGNAFIYYSSSIVSALIVDVWKDRMLDLITGLFYVFELVLYINLYTVFRYPNGILQTDVYFLGLDNTFLVYIFPAILICFLLIYNKKKVFRSLLLILASLLTLIKTQTMTSLIALLIFFALMLFFALTRYKNINTKFMSLIAVFLNVFFIFMYRVSNISYLKFIISDILDKNESFASRVRLWQRSVSLISQSPITGYGRGSRIRMGFTLYDHAHNLLLQQCIIGGIVSLALYCLFHYFIIKKVDKMKNDFIKALFCSFLFACYIAFISEAYLAYWRLYLAFFIIYFYKDYLKKHDESS